MRVHIHFGPCFTIIDYDLSATLDTGDILKGSIIHWEKKGRKRAAKRQKIQLKKLEEKDADELQGYL